MKFMAPATAAAALLASIAAPSAAITQEAEQAPASQFSINSPLEALMADEAARAVVAKHLGGQDLTQHPYYENIKTLSLKEIARYSQGKLTDELLEKIDADLVLLDR